MTHSGKLHLPHRTLLTNNGVGAIANGGYTFKAYFEGYTNERTQQGIFFSLAEDLTTRRLHRRPRALRRAALALRTGCDGVPPPRPDPNFPHATQTPSAFAGGVCCFWGGKTQTPHNGPVQMPQLDGPIPGLGPNNLSTHERATHDPAPSSPSPMNNKPKTANWTKVGTSRRLVRSSRSTDTRGRMSLPVLVALLLAAVPLHAAPTISMESPSATPLGLPLVPNLNASASAHTHRRWWPPRLRRQTNPPRPIPNPPRCAGRRMPSAEKISRRS